MLTLATLILLLPGLAALIVSLLTWVIPSQKQKDMFAMGFTSLTSVICAVMAAIVFYNIGYTNAPIVQEQTLLHWLQGTNLHANFGVYLDKLTATMLLVVCSVSACVHVYSIGYMHEDKAKPRFFALLSFFTFTMLLLVTAPNVLQMFLGWEGVGVASYLLIGFWFHKDSANAASMKAFITNRVADAALLIALFLTVLTFGSLHYAEILPRVAEFSGSTFNFLGYNFGTIELIAGLFFLGAMGKSAQFGLHVWLPDAMEGPTPVSALIHAATMVTAGVFLLCRLSPLFAAAPFTLECVAYVGALTAIFAATVGLTQTDIKRVIAYSTCSQLGYMFFAIGVGAYSAAMFHLTTHAFFKALLFLGAGSVIHALHHEQDLFKMGGVRKLLPITYGLMWLGSLALIGIPPFAGFFSKELIIESAFAAGTNTGYILYTLGTIGALLTAFYSCRVIFMAFHGKFKGEKRVLSHAHESPLIMLLPMLPLAVGAVLSGWLLHNMAQIAWWQGVLAQPLHHHAHHPDVFWRILPLIAAVGGIALSWLFYIKKQYLAQKWAKGADLLYRMSFNKWYVDEIYEFLIVQPLRKASHVVWRVGDVQGIDFIVNSVANAVYKTGAALKTVQSGYVFTYAFGMMIALVISLGIVLFTVFGG